LAAHRHHLTHLTMQPGEVMMQRQFAQRAYRQSIRKHHAKSDDSDEWRGREAESRHTAPSNDIVNLQHTIGNRAVQRMLASDRAQAVGPASVVQRAPNDSGKGQDKGGPTAKVAATQYLAELTLERQGELKGGSRIEGFEGHVPVLSLGFDANAMKPGRDKESSSTELVVTRLADDLSPRLMKAYTEGEKIDSATFRLVKLTADGKYEVVGTFEFSDGTISSYNASNNEEGPIDVISINFLKGP
jgi:type VI protein secretion system component Hcp